MIKANVIELFISVDEEKKRVSKDVLQLDEGGIFDDKFYAKNKDRLILITSIVAYTLAYDNGIEMEYGSLGENILINQNISHLNVGDCFQVGELFLEITQNCTICKGLSIIDSKLPEVLKSDRGVFAKAMGSGFIKKGDIVII